MRAILSHACTSPFLRPPAIIGLIIGRSSLVAHFDRSDLEYSYSRRKEAPSTPPLSLHVPAYHNISWLIVQLRSHTLTLLIPTLETSLLRETRSGNMTNSLAPKLSVHDNNFSEADTWVIIPLVRTLSSMRSWARVQSLVDERFIRVRSHQIISRLPSIPFPALAMFDTYLAEKPVWLRSGSETKTETVSGKRSCQVIKKNQTGRYIGCLLAQDAHRAILGFADRSRFNEHPR